MYGLVVIMKTNDYIKYVTQEFVKYMNQPEDVKKRLKEEKKQNQEPFLSRWFGVLPISVSMMMSKDGANDLKEQVEEEKETS
ncbi:MAG: hypothetical protein K0S34_382 [Bacillales bacterium]|jgi:hypothetical protein|nr:hypothetical protein [Bacillales bacterium]